MPSDALGDTATTPVIARPALAPGHDRSTGSGLSRAAHWVQARAMFIIAISAVLILILLGIPKHLSQDGWLALISGRVIATHGVPQHDYFSALTHGARWVDQQWLAQLVMYVLAHVGGLQLLTVACVLSTVAGFVVAMAAARRL